jgi:hypothetical protein
MILIEGKAVKLGRAASQLVPTPVLAGLPGRIREFGEAPGRGRRRRGALIT